VRTATDNAQLALLLEVTGTPKPGNVDRHRDFPHLRFEHFVAGAVGARDGLAAAADGAPVGEAFERAVAGMSEQSGGNTQFGAVLLLTPLVRAAGAGDLDPESASAVVEGTTVTDGVGFYRAFDHVDVAVAEPPADLDAPDVRLGGDAAEILREAGLTLADVMAESARLDGVAAEWTEGFPRTFEAAASLAEKSGPVGDRTATVYLEQLASAVDTFVVTQHGRSTAETVRERAAAALAGEEDPADLAEDLVSRGINPGTTADVTAGALFVALDRGLEV
jgi:triphosphoribosyl-dephospho-CoA synthase